MGTFDSDIIDAVSGTCVLELGCGYAKNAIELARRGHEVTCIDSDEDAITHVRSIAADEGLKLHALFADLNAYTIEGTYDTVIVNGVFHFIERERTLELIEAARTHTRNGGVHLIAALLRGDPTDATGHYFSPGELHTIYADWHILEYEEYEEPDPTGTVNLIAWIIARKPNGA